MLNIGIYTLHKWNRKNKSAVKCYNVTGADMWQIIYWYKWIQWYLFNKTLTWWLHFTWVSVDQLQLTVILLCCQNSDPAHCSDMLHTKTWHWLDKWKQPHSEWWWSTSVCSNAALQARSTQQWILSFSKYRHIVFIAVITQALLQEGCKLQKMQ